MSNGVGHGQWYCETSLNPKSECLSSLDSTLNVLPFLVSDLTFLVEYVRNSAAANSV